MPTADTAVVIEEVGVTDPIKITLTGDDLPKGGQRDEALWQEGGDVKVGSDPKGVWLPGRKKPIFFALYADETQRKIKGRLGDHFHGVDGYADGIKNQCERLRKRMNIVRVTWAGREFRGMLVNATWDIEGPHDLTYELTFSVGEVAEGGSPERLRAKDPNDTADSNMVTQLRADLEARRAEVLALSLQQQVVVQLTTAFTQLDSVMADAESALRIVEAGTLGKANRIMQSINRAISSAGAVQDQAKRLADYFKDKSPSDLLDASAVNKLGASMRTEAVSRDTVEATKAIRDAMRSARVQQTALLRKSSRIYVVQEGDTAATIAQMVLGNRARAEELGVTQRDLVPGRKLRLPEA